MIEPIKKRLAHIEARLLKLSKNHKKVHDKCFPKDGSDGTYKAYEKVRSKWFDETRDERELLKEAKLFDQLEEFEAKAPIFWEDTPESDYLDKSLLLMRTIDEEVIGCKAYLMMFNETHFWGERDLKRDVEKAVNKYYEKLDKENSK